MIVIHKLASSKVWSIFLSSIVLIILMLAVPAFAVQVDVRPEKSVYLHDQKVTFVVSVDLKSKERIPVEGLQLLINHDDELIKQCSFSTDGSNSCDHITISVLNAGTQDTGTLSGRGFGYGGSGSPATQEVDYGFGYGFIYEKFKSNLNGELSYLVTWDITNEQLPLGKYEASVEADTGANGVDFTFLSKRTRKFNIKFNPTEEIKQSARIRAETETGLTSLLNHTSFSRQRSKFNGNLRHTTQGIFQDIDGRASLTIYAESGESKLRLTLTMNSNQIDPLSFLEDDISFEGSAKVRYKETNRNNPTISFNDEIDDVSVSVTGGTVSILSTDSQLPFSITMPVSSLDFNS